jgi:hypothetical protein
MARKHKEITVEEFNAWCAANKKFGAVAQAADEEGGPRLSLVPPPEQNIAWPTDLLPPNPPPARLGEGAEARSLSGGQASTVKASPARQRSAGFSPNIVSIPSGASLRKRSAARACW